MELIIVICLLVVIMLLISDKIEKRKIIYQKGEPQKPKTEDDIMGKTKNSQLKHIWANESQNLKGITEPDSFVSESKPEDKMHEKFLQEEPEINSDALPDFQQEEEEFRILSMSEQNSGFTQGVTFDELGTVGKMLQEEDLEQSQKETAAVIAQKIHGTELLSLLENSIENVSEKVRELLETHLSIDKSSGSSTMQNNGIKDFDIGEFV